MTSTARTVQGAESDDWRRASIVGFPRTTTLALWAAAIVAVWGGARIVYFNGYYTEDAPGYVSDAVSIALGQYQPRYDVNGLNIGTYAPVALPLLVFGKSEFALSLWPLLCSLLGVFSVAAVAALLCGWPFGVLAAFLYATYPGDVFFSTVVMPDAIQSGWLSFSLFLVVFGWLAPPHRQERWLLAAGAAMGVCHLVRANGALLLPIGVCAVGVLSRYQAAEPLMTTLRRCAVYGSGWVLVLMLEALTYGWVVGDRLFRFHVVDRHYGSLGSIAQWGLNIHPLTIPYSAFAPLTWFRWGGWGEFNQDQAYHGLLFTWGVLALVFGGAAAALNRRNVPRRLIAALAIAAFWLTWPLLYHQLGSQSLRQFIPIHRLSRHLVVYAPGAIIAIAVASSILWSAARRATVRAVYVAVTIPLLVFHVHANVKAEMMSYRAYHQIKDTYSRIRDRLPPETRTIAADPGDLGFFDFWLNPMGAGRVRLVALANYASCEDLRAAVVLTYSNPGWQGFSAPVIQETVKRLPCLVTPPPSWRLMYDGYPEKVYLLE